jgi:hypothetical protein
VHALETQQKHAPHLEKARRLFQAFCLGRLIKRAYGARNVEVIRVGQSTSFASATRTRVPAERVMNRFESYQIEQAHSTRREEEQVRAELNNARRKENVEFFHCAADT